MNQAEFKKSVEGLFKQQEKLLARRNRKSAGGNGVYDRYELHDLISRTMRGGGGDDDGRTLQPPSAPVTRPEPRSRGQR